MKRSKRLFFTLHLAALLLALFPILSLIRGQSPFRLGLDLAGGIRVTYRPDLTTRLEWTQNLSDHELLTATKEVLSSRLSRVLNTIPDIVVRSDQRIVVSIPGTQDQKEVLDLVGRTYRLTFRTVESERDSGASTTATADTFSYHGRALALSPPAFSGDMLEAGSIQVATGADIGRPFAGASVQFRFQRPYEADFADFTRQHIGGELAILIDNDVEWVGTIESAIQGTGSLSGHYSPDEANEIALMLRSGSLPVSLTVEDLEAVTPSLGREIQELGVDALLATVLCLIVLVGLAYLHRGWLLVNGWVALLYLLLLIAGLTSLFDLTLDMVGIAAIVLAVGMGMDGFVLVFESLTGQAPTSREATSKQAATRDPASRLARGAYSLASEGGALLHGNVTTLLVVLLLLGSERLRSFAIFTLVGLAASALTIFLTRENLRFTPSTLASLPFDLLAPLRRFKGRLFRLRSLYYAAVVVAAISIGGLLETRGPQALELGDDFTPGSQLEVRGNAEAVGRAVEATRRALPGVAVKSQALWHEDEDTAPSTVSRRSASPGDATTRHLVSLSTSLGERLEQDGAHPTASLSTPELLALFEAESVTVDRLLSIDGKVSAKRLASSLEVLLVSFLLLGLYFAFVQERIERLLSASPPPGIARAVRVTVLYGILTAVVLDLLFVTTAMALFRIPINLPVVGAALSIIGYSVNDSVVLWSFIRKRWTESRRETPRPSALAVVTESVDAVLSRTVLTSLSTLVPAIMILIVGLTPLVDFALVLLVGIVAGTFSSLFVVGSFARRALEGSAKRAGASVASRREGVREPGLHSS